MRTLEWSSIARLAGALAVIAGCRGPHAPLAPKATWLVVAPHPDDETLIASGVIASAVEAGERVEVVILTNGDYDCVVSGYIRQRESVDGLAQLGLPETAIHFLGYPDGGLPHLGFEKPLDQRRVDRNGTCTLGNATYGARGFAGAEAHRARTGEHATFTRGNLVGDLAREIAELHPTDIVVTHPMDTHPDHASAYHFVRDALDTLDFAPRIHRALVHNGDCWPTGGEPHEPCPPPSFDTDMPTPQLTGQLAGYIPRERRAVPPPMLVRERDRNPKLLAIGAHRTQTRGAEKSYLYGFARQDEPFFPEQLVREGRRWVRVGRAGRRWRQRIRRGNGRAVLTEAGEAYEVVVDTTHRQAECRRARDGVLLSTWPLPFDLWTTEEEEEELTVAIEARPEDGDVVEVSLRWGEALVGVAVDPRGLR